MPRQYSYTLKRQVFRDVSGKQAARLAQDGYVAGERGEMLKYKETWEDAVTKVVKWLRPEKAEVPVNRYEEEYAEKRWSVEYSETPAPKGFFGRLWGAVSAPFRRRTKEMVTSGARLDELRSLAAEGKITKLSEAAADRTSTRLVELTQDEAAAELGSGMRLRLVAKGVGKKEVTEYDEVTEDVPEERYAAFSTNKDVVSVSERREKRLKDKVVVDARVPEEAVIQVYKAGVWSSGGKDQDATFVASVTVKFMSGDNPLDPSLLDRASLEEEVVGIIKEEHGTARFIEERNDGRNGFAITPAQIKR